jgi:hypothetical protein
VLLLSWKKNPTPINEFKQGTLLHIRHLSKIFEQIDDLLLHIAEELLLESEQLEFISADAISTWSPDADVAALAAEEASLAAFLALGNAWR